MYIYMCICIHNIIYIYIYIYTYIYTYIISSFPLSLFVTYTPSLAICVKHSACTLYSRSSIYSVYLNAYLTILLTIYLSKRLATFFIQRIRASLFLSLVPFLDYSYNRARIRYRPRFKKTCRYFSDASTKLGHPDRKCSSLCDTRGISQRERILPRLQL